VKLIYWVKFANSSRPDKFVFENMEQLFHDLREFMLRNPTGILEWMVRD